jgi:hypothetical protein
MLTNRNLVPGKKYVVAITGLVGKAVALCTEEKDKYNVCILEVLSEGFMKGVRLKHDDYIPREEYDENIHGKISE